MSQAALDQLVALFDLEPLEVNLFRGVSLDTERPRVYGGQVLAQALVAAGRTVGCDHRVHSMHAYFLRLGDPRHPIVFDVDRIRDGRSFTTRRVVAVQHGEAIFNLAASFHVDEGGPEHSEPMPDVPGAESLAPSEPERDDAALIDRGPRVADAIEMRGIGDAHPDPSGISGPGGEPDRATWFRARGELTDDPLLHAAVVAYASDFTLLGTATLPHRVAGVEEPFMMASLDHVMWFHRALRADEWLLYSTHSPAAGAGRGFATGRIFRADGALAVSVAQEGLLRPLR